MKISFFENATSTSPKDADSNAVMAAILNGRWSEKIGDIRLLDEKEYKEAKKSLPCVTWSGNFSERKASALIEYSQLVVLDIDNISAEQIASTKEELILDKHVVFAFISPSGNGLKIIYKVNTGAAYHKSAFNHLQDYFQKKYLLKVDESGKDVSRLCFISWDNEAVTNEDVEDFIVDIAYGEVAKKTRDESFKNYSSEKDYSKLFELCQRWVEGPPTAISYVTGQRNRYVHALSCAMNRVGVPMTESVKLLEAKYTDLDPLEAFKACKSAYFHNQSEFNSVEVKNIKVGEYKAPPYVQNYTDNVVQNDIMFKTAMLFNKGVDMKEISDIIAKIVKYYDGAGFIDYSRKTVVDLMNQGINTLNQKVAEQSSELSLKYESAEDIGAKLINQDFIKGLVPTYIGDLDASIGGGLRAKSFYGLIGLGGTFKSIILQYIAYANAVNGIPVLYLNSEMSMDQFYERLASMVFGINFHHEITSGRLTKENISGFIDKMKSELGNNLFVFNGSGFNEENIVATLSNIKATTGKVIRFIGIDGISQFDSMGKEEIPAAIFNTGVCKEIAKKCNDGEGAVVVGLMHTSGDQNYLFRDTGLKCRGGIKTIANMDGYMSVSLLLDPETNSLENEEDALYLPGKVYLRFKDKRTRTGIVNRIVNIDDRTLHLSTENCNVQDYETKITIKRK